MSGLPLLSRRLMEVQEAERRHLARELHDEIGQYLTGVSLILGDLERRPLDTARAPLREAHTLVDDLIVRVRDLSLDLRPAMLDDLGLLPALLWLFERFSKQTNLEIDFHHTGVNRRFQHDVETAAYRIVQEALTNVARHAGVSQALVHVSADDHRLSVVDCGSRQRLRRGYRAGNRRNQRFLGDARTSDARWRPPQR